MDPLDFLSRLAVLLPLDRVEAAPEIAEHLHGILCAWREEVGRFSLQAGRAEEFDARLRDMRALGYAK